MSRIASINIAQWLRFPQQKAAYRCGLVPRLAAEPVQDPAMVSVRCMLDQHSNAFVEALNGLLKQGKRVARGFRTNTNFTAIAQLRMGKLTQLADDTLASAMPR